MSVVKGSNSNSNGMEKVLLRDDAGCSAEVYLHGGHVSSWKNEKGEELLFVSNKAIFEPHKPIRGGIPICFPQFSNLRPLPSHGFARTKIWSIDKDPQLDPPPNSNSSSSGPFVDLLLTPSEDDFKIWPHRVLVEVYSVSKKGNKEVYGLAIQCLHVAIAPYLFDVYLVCFELIIISFGWHVKSAL